jgi:hypothetical protein
MPRYYNLPDWYDKGRVTVTPKPFWRRVPILKLFPYYVGDTISFHIHFEKPLVKSILSPCNIYEKKSDEWKALINIVGTDADVTGSRIYSEGDVVYFVGVHPNKDYLEPIFTTTVNSWDTITNKWFLLIGGAIIGWLLTSGINFIKGLLK